MKKKTHDLWTLVSLNFIIKIKLNIMSRKIEILDFEKSGRVERVKFIW